MEAPEHKGLFKNILSVAPTSFVHVCTLGSLVGIQYFGRDESKWTILSDMVSSQTCDWALETHQIIQVMKNPASECIV